MQRYFVKGKDQNDNFIFENSDIHHIKNVMRYIIGDLIEVVYQEKIYLCKITELNPLSVIIDKEKEENNEMPLDLTIAIGLVNEQKFDLIIQKLTELGVKKIIPVQMERSVIKLDKNKFEKKKERWQKICKEASEQSHRSIVPEVTDIMTINDLSNEENELKLICSLSDDTKQLDSYLTKTIKKILFVIGPEGGFTTKEELILTNNNFKKTKLSKRVFRVETAAIYVASIINYVYKG